MKIAFILDEPWDSALTSYTLSIEKMVSSLHDTVILCLDKSPIKRARKNTITIKPLRNKNPLVSLKGFIYLSRLLKEIKPNAVVTIRGDATFFCCLLKKSLNFKLFRVFGEDKQLRSPPNCIDTLILPCDFLINRIPPRRADKIVVHKSFVDRDRFSFSSESRKHIRKELGVDNRFVFGAVGRFDRVKGFDMLIEAFSLTKFNNAMLVIVGEEKGLKRDNLLDVAKRCGIEDRVFVIAERRPDIVDIMSSFDVGVVSSVGSEVIPRVFFEFMSIGLPIVTTDVGCLKEVAKPEFAIVTKPTTTDMKQALKKVKSADLVKMSKAALSWANKYSLKIPDFL